MSLDYLENGAAADLEYPVLILLSTVGMGMLISAGDLIALISGLS
jgi:NADH-quinone oxidoreductase subunit N